MKPRALGVLVVLLVAGYVFLQGDGSTVPSVGPSSSPLPEAPIADRWTVDHVFDGDSFRATRDDLVVEVRLAQIDAPEQGDCWATESRQWLVDAIDSRRVTLTGLSDGPNADRFGRLVRDVVLDGASINEAAVLAGTAEHREEFSEEDPALAARLRSAEIAAREARAGIWANC